MTRIKIGSIETWLGWGLVLDSELASSRFDVVG